jgi:hypothetical protein
MPPIPHVSDDHTTMHIAKSQKPNIKISTNSQMATTHILCHVLTMAHATIKPELSGTPCLNSATSTNI